MARARSASKKSARPKARPTTRSAARRSSGARLIILVGTRKGAFLLHGDPFRRRFTIDGPHFLGNIVHHVVLDPRDRRTLLASAKTGHLGPTIFRSTNLGRAWKEAGRPPAFPRSNVDPAGGTADARGGSAAEAPAGGAAASGAAGDAKPRAVDATFWLTPGHTEEKDVWWAGTIPGGLFHSADGGVTWDPIDGFNRNPMGVAWGPPYFGDTPEGSITHSILVDPRDARHMYAGLSTGGFYETTDRGARWKPLNEGMAADFLPDKDPVYGHDPHCVVLHPQRPDRLFQASHCGIYRLDRPGDTWQRIGRNMPKEIGDIGFPIVAHPGDPDTAWVFPMDGTTVWPRTSPGGRPAVYRTRDAGATWERQDRGLPREQAWFTVKRQAMAGDDLDPVGLYFGTTSGEMWMSRDEGRTWGCIAAHLPHVYSIVATRL